MIMADLKTNYVDDVLDTTKNQLRKYQQIQNDDGTVSFVDVTEYTQVGTSFGAKDINDTNAAINDVNRKLSQAPVLIATSTSGSYTIQASEIDTYKKIQVIAINTSLNANTEITMDVSVLKELGTGKTYTHMVFSSGSGVGFLTQVSISYTTNGDIECLGMCKGWVLQHIKVYGYK